MKLEDVKNLMKEFDESGIFRMALELDGLTLELEKEPVREAVVMQAAPTLQAMPQTVQAQPSILETSNEIDKQESTGTPVKSPVVGTFYCASSPEAEPYVRVGSRVKKGQTLCIVEAMKMMNEITAPVSGEVVEILLEQEQMVEFDQTIMLIKE